MRRLEDTISENSSLPRAWSFPIFIYHSLPEDWWFSISKNSKMCTFWKMCTFLENVHIFRECAHFLGFLNVSDEAVREVGLLTYVGECSIVLFRSRMFYFWSQLCLNCSVHDLLIVEKCMILEMCTFSENVHIFNSIHADEMWSKCAHFAKSIEFVM